MKKNSDDHNRLLSDSGPKKNVFRDQLINDYYCANQRKLKKKTLHKYSRILNRIIAVSCVLFFLTRAVNNNSEEKIEQFVIAPNDFVIVGLQIA